MNSHPSSIFLSRPEKWQPQQREVIFRFDPGGTFRSLIWVAPLVELEGNNPAIRIFDRYSVSMPSSEYLKDIAGILVRCDLDYPRACGGECGSRRTVRVYTEEPPLSFVFCIVILHRVYPPMRYFNLPHDIRSSINQPLHPRLVPLGSLFHLIRLFRLLAITVSACSDNYFKSALDGAKRRLRCGAPMPGSSVGAPTASRR